MNLFRRRYRLRVDAFDVSSLDIAFEVEKSIKREPNKAAITVRNLPPELRQFLAQLSTKKKKGPGKISVSLEAGYVDGTSLIFRGDLRTSVSERDDGGTWTTKIEGEDGGRAVLWSRVNRSFPPGTRVDAVVLACASAMGVDPGNAQAALAGARLENGGDVYTAGTVLSGPAPDELDGVLRSVGFSWSVQNGVLQVLRRGRAAQPNALLLTGASGLVGAPSRASDGTIKFKTLLIPDLWPGRQVALREEQLSGVYRVTKAKYTGDNRTDEWHIDGEATELQRVGT